MKYVSAIASADQKERRDAILRILEEIGTPGTIQPVDTDGYPAENIIVSLNPSDHRLVIGAHWDSVEGSTGANDNASSCAILLRLLEKVKDTSRSLEFVFFDREEHPAKGSAAYIDVVGKENISAMVCLDVCGHGDRMAMWAKGNEGNPLFFNLMGEEDLKSHGVEILSYMPKSDDRSFSDAGIPNIEISTLNERDMIFFRRMAEVVSAGGTLSDEEKAAFKTLDIMATMHHGANDSIAAVRQEPMDLVLDYLYQGLKD